MKNIERNQQKYIKTSKQNAMVGELYLSKIPNKKLPEHEFDYFEEFDKNKIEDFMYDENDIIGIPNNTFITGTRYKQHDFFIVKRYKNK